MIDAKQAVDAAVKFFSELFGSRPDGLRVEEAILSDDSQYWTITLSFYGDEIVVEFPSSLIGSQGEAVVHPKHQREYRLFRVRRNNSEVEEMSIRTLAHT